MVGFPIPRLQASDPGPGFNWLPTPGDDDFYLVLRLYQPRAVHLQMRFDYQPLMRDVMARFVSGAPREILEDEKKKADKSTSRSELLLKKVA